ncbi:MAG: immunoglobulin domain-containing protein [Planctomycetes bacterium]|nr:immunoglobulin domain-containing protein [Planctomycetota bacterium]
MRSKAMSDKKINGRGGSTPWVLVGAMVASGAAFAQPASFVALGDLAGGAFYSEASNLSADGRTVVGLGSDSVGLQPVVWRDGVAVVLDKPSGYSQGSASAVSGDGVVIVGTVGVHPNVRGVIWRPDGLRVVPPTATYSAGSALTDVSFDGNIAVGWCTGGAGYQAIRHFNGVSTPLANSGDTAVTGVSADGLVAVGRRISPGYSLYEACRWIENGPAIGMGDLPGGLSLSDGYDANADGSVVVGVVNTEASQTTSEEAGRWQNGVWMSLGDLPGGAYNSLASGVTDDGTIVVGRGTTAAGQEAFVWDSTNGMRSLRSVLSGQFGVDLSGWRLTLARRLSGDGTHVVGRGINPAGNTEAFVAYVPCFVPPRMLSEPSSTSVCVAGEVGITARAGGGGTGHLLFRWRVNGVPITDGETTHGSIISGATTATLTIANAAPQDAGMYDCMITNPCGQITSDAATLAVCACLACPADFNQDGGIDGTDVDGFFGAWEQGHCDADVNGDGGVDGADVDSFYAAWEAGGCG